MAGGVYDTKRHSNVKRRAEYRRINRYYKSVEKSKAEKARRRMILDLLSQGLTIKAIATRLGVCERTVKRDLSRMEPYFKKMRTQLLHMEQTEFLAGLDGLSQREQLEAIHRYLACNKKVTEPRGRKNLLLTVNLDSVFRGSKGVKFKPELPVKMLENGRITVELEAGGQKQAVVRVYVGKIGSGMAYLSVNDSMCAFVDPILKGLRFVPSANSDSTRNDS